MGLHTTPYGSFYVQRDLKTGEIIQVLPVQAKDTPGQLPSVGSLGIDENFIESRRATFEANNVRASDSQGRLQRELATAGGRRLLETGRAVIAQRDDHSQSHSQSHSSPSAAYHDGDVDMAYAQAPAAHAHTQYPYSSAPSDSRHTSSTDTSSSRRRGSSMNVHYTLSEDPHQQSLHTHPVRPWPESLPHEHTVSLPPFRAIGLATAPSREDEGRRHDERVSSRGTPTSSHHNYRSNSTALSISSMVADSEGGSTCSASEASTPTALSPMPDYGYCSTGHGYSPLPAHPGCAALPPPSFASPAPSSAAAKKQKTVWIIRTLEPRKTAPNGDEYDDYEPQRVKTHVETHMAS